MRRGRPLVVKPMSAGPTRVRTNRGTRVAFPHANVRYAETGALSTSPAARARHARNKGHALRPSGFAEAFGILCSRV